MTTHAVFFDFYNTLVRFWPPTEQIQRQAAANYGIVLTDEGVIRGYASADAYMSEQNAAATPVFQRSPEDRTAFFNEYEHRILVGAGASVSKEMAGKVWAETQKIKKDLTLFDDVKPALTALKEAGVIIGVISNMRGDLRSIVQGLGVGGLVDVTVTSEEAGAEKPHAPIFKAALERAGVTARQAIHVGDQYLGDVQGARGAGIKPVLLDRYGLLTEYTDCVRIASLEEVLPLVVKKAVAQ